MYRRTARRTTPCLSLLLAVGISCSSGAGPSTETTTQAIRTYAEIVHASYEDSVRGVEALRDAIRVFVAEPSEDTQDAAKQAWLAAREPYGQTEAYRFYGGPIDDVDGPEPLINAWPLDEAYIDSVVGDPKAGLIHATDQELTAELLLARNESGAEENVSVGFHAIEFLLWGQDLSDDGPGGRPFTDYVEGDGTNAARRGRYLQIAADLLVGHLQQVADAWTAGEPDNYRAKFVSQEPDLALQAIFTGIGVLSKSELAGERLFTALDNRSQEDEHSCFSDNTHRDTATNAQGIANVLRGSYTRVDGSTVSGPGVLDVVGEVDAVLAESLRELNAAAIAAVESVPVPFDRAIIEESSRELVLEAVYALQDQGDRIAEAASALGLAINTALPE